MIIWITPADYGPALSHLVADRIHERGYIYRDPQLRKGFDGFLPVQVHVNAGERPLANATAATGSGDNRHVFRERLTLTWDNLTDDVNSVTNLLCWLMDRPESPVMRYTELT